MDAPNSVAGDWEAWIPLLVRELVGEYKGGLLIQIRQPIYLA